MTLVLNGLTVVSGNRGALVEAEAKQLGRLTLIAKAIGQARLRLTLESKPVSLSVRVVP